MALAAVKELGAAGRAGAGWRSGCAGPPGAAEPGGTDPDATAALAEAERRIAALQTSHRQLSRKFKRLRHQMKGVTAAR